MTFADAEGQHARHRRLGRHPPAARLAAAAPCSDPPADLRRRAVHCRPSPCRSRRSPRRLLARRPRSRPARNVRRSRRPSAGAGRAGTSRRPRSASRWSPRPLWPALVLSGRLGWRVEPRSSGAGARWDARGDGAARRPLAGAALRGPSARAFRPRGSARRRRRWSRRATARAGPCGPRSLPERPAPAAARPSCRPPFRSGAPRPASASTSR